MSRSTRHIRKCTDVIQDDARSVLSDPAHAKMGETENGIVGAYANAAGGMYDGTLVGQGDGGDVWRGDGRRTRRRKIGECVLERLVRVPSFRVRSGGTDVLS